jgi:hypothetical protein
VRGQEIGYIDRGYGYLEAQPWRRSMTMTITAGQRGTAIHLLPRPPPPLLLVFMEGVDSHHACTGSVSQTLHRNSQPVPLPTPETRDPASSCVCCESEWAQG